MTAAKPCSLSFSSESERGEWKRRRSKKKKKKEKTVRLLLFFFLHRSTIFIRKRTGLGDTAGDTSGQQIGGELDGVGVGGPLLLGRGVGDGPVCLVVGLEFEIPIRVSRTSGTIKRVEGGPRPPAAAFASFSSTLCGAAAGRPVA